MDTSAISAPALPTTMRAARLHARGGPARIVVESAAVPSLRSRDALVEVHAAGITPSELGWGPTWVREDGSDRTPIIPSHEVAGVVVAVGRDADESLVGERVFGLIDFFRDGAAAEYTTVKASDLALWPTTVDPATAAALPLSGLTAWQALLDHGSLAAGQRVLVLGAAGGVGSFTVQLARWRKAHVTALGSARDVEFLRELGSDEVIDRDAASFDEIVSDIDLVVDTVGGETLERAWVVLAPRGRIVSIAPSSREIAKRDPRGRFFIVTPDRRELAQLSQLVEKGELRAVIERTFTLDQTREAYEFGRDEHPRGKVVLRVRD